MEVPSEKPKPPGTGPIDLNGPSSTTGAGPVKVQKDKRLIVSFPGKPKAQPKADAQVDLTEVYFLILHILSGTQKLEKISADLEQKLLELDLLPHRYHGHRSTDPELQRGQSVKLRYKDVAERYAHISPSHLTKLLQELLNQSRLKQSPGAADVPTLLGLGRFSLLQDERTKAMANHKPLPPFLHWPHTGGGPSWGFYFRELGGGFARFNNNPASLKKPCYALLEPTTWASRLNEPCALRGHRNAVYCALFDRTGQYMVTGSDDRLVKIWSAETALLLRSCRGHQGDITDMAISSDNKLLASGSNDHTIRVWSLPGGVPRAVLMGHSEAVTAVTFSPRTGSEHILLSSSEDNTCRMWDARKSTGKVVIYEAAPQSTPAQTTSPEAAPPRPIQILCLTFNADGRFFVTGSTDKLARVWRVRDQEGLHEEPEVLSGHQDDVNFVQFSGCSAPLRTSQAADVARSQLPTLEKPKDNIVTCSRDGSAIIWMPKTKRRSAVLASQAKGGALWQAAYVLKVPPPPPPPQVRGLPRRRTPQRQGVNMAVWSLDNQFVLAAIMDCRICVWNAIDGRLVHSLNGHTKQTYVLDVHPSDPRIALSAGYDGMIFIWDIWKGRSVRQFDMGDIHLVDGHFAPQGDSIVVSDEIGQIYYFSIGPLDSRRDAMYDQYFKGDFLPLIHDSEGNVIDQETSLPPHERNLIDVLCASDLVPYSEPYQTKYQAKRLKILGLSPPATRLSNNNLEHSLFQPRFAIAGPPPLPPRNPGPALFLELLEGPEESQERIESDYHSEESEEEVSGSDEERTSRGSEREQEADASGGLARGTNMTRSGRRVKKSTRYLTDSDEQEVSDEGIRRGRAGERHMPATRSRRVERSTQPRRQRQSEVIEDEPHMTRRKRKPINYSAPPSEDDFSAEDLPMPRPSTSRRPTGGQDLDTGVAWGARKKRRRLNGLIRTANHLQQVEGSDDQLSTPGDGPSLRPGSWDDGPSSRVGVPRTRLRLPSSRAALRSSRQRVPDSHVPREGASSPTTVAPGSAPSPSHGVPNLREGEPIPRADTPSLGASDPTSSRPLRAQGPSSGSPDGLPVASNGIAEQEEPSPSAEPLEETQIQTVEATGKAKVLIKLRRRTDRLTPSGEGSMPQGLVDLQDNQGGNRRGRRKANPKRLN